MARPVSQGGIDYPDGGFSGGQGGFPMVGNLAELAVRLGSINAYDRRGDVIWMTDFEDGLQGSGFGSDHADSVGYLSAARAFHGAYSAKLDPRGVADSYVNLGRVIHFVPTGNVGIEYSMSLDTNPTHVRLCTWYRDGSTAYESALKYLPATGNWQILTSEPAWVTILSGFKLQQGAAAWHPIKLVLDVENGKYVRALISRHSVDISAYSMYEVASSALGQFEIRVQCWGDPATHAPVYIDGIIVTQNES